MSGPAHVVVAIPARNERDHIAGCLHAVCRSLAEARRRGLVERATVEVAAHRCSDDTGLLAARVLTARLGRVMVDSETEFVGAVRDDAVRRGLRVIGGDHARVWVLSTDADTLVGVDWVSQILTLAKAADVKAVVGLATLDRWQGHPAGRRVYEALLASKMRDDGPSHQHDHVYGANLAVRGDVYLAVGGFPRDGHGEDQLLVNRIAAGGHRIVRTRDVAVTTSGRFVGRAEGGLAAHLRRLDAQACQDMAHATTGSGHAH
ncbi:MAG: hypothetical protein H0T17_01920 [Propionibacteriales bacterium]|nr:hypothetical protein [Propionibacteriales bacterium]